MKIVFFSLKGGVGKTTMSFCIVSALKEAGVAIKFIDYDPQASATAWLGIDEFKDSGNPEITIVDTPPRADHKLTLNELKTADKIIIPCSPSMADVPAAQATLALIQKFAPKSNVYIAWSRVDSRKTIKIRNLPAVAEIIGTSPLKSYTRDLDCYENIGGGGFSVLSDSAKNEVLKLSLEILNK